MKKLKELLRKHLPKSRFGQDKLFCKHWYSNFYYVGWYKKGDKKVWTIRIQYPASSPAGFINDIVGISKEFDV